MLLLQIKIAPTDACGVMTQSDIQINGAIRSQPILIA